MLVNEDIDEITKMIIELENESMKAGLEMNSEKIKMLWKMEGETEIEIGRGTIAWTEEIIYLG